MKSTRRIVVIGAGASGLMAAGTAALQGADVLLLEKKPQPGLKLRITGRGRCNLTNTAELDEFMDRFGRQGKFLRQAFTGFFSHDLVAFFGELGVRTCVEAQGRIFAAGNDATVVAERLEQWAQQSGVRVRTVSPVTEILVADSKIAGVRTDRNRFEAEAVILATGGASYPATGSTGDGYRLAEKVGHTIVPIRPALVPIETSSGLARRLQGLSLTDVAVHVLVDGQSTAETQGELLFTHFGLSGPSILPLSRGIVDALREGQTVAISIDLKPTLKGTEIDPWLQKHFSGGGKRQIGTLLKEMLPQRLAEVCVEQVAIPEDRTGSQITAEERHRLATWLKDFRFKVSGYRPIAEATVTAGGVSTKEIDPRTMQSRLITGLYFAGEVIDIDADTGGFNLQAAFSTGRLAGLSATT
jgi:predicted Rossmann fold flavoprotein